MWLLLGIVAHALPPVRCEAERVDLDTLLPALDALDAAVEAQPHEALAVAQRTESLLVCSRAVLPPELLVRTYRSLADAWYTGAETIRGRAWAQSAWHLSREARVDLARTDGREGHPGTEIILEALSAVDFHRSPVRPPQQPACPVRIDGLRLGVARGDGDSLHLLQVLDDTGGVREAFLVDPPTWPVVLCTEPTVPVPDPSCGEVTDGPVLRGVGVAGTLLGAAVVGTGVALATRSDPSRAGAPLAFGGAALGSGGWMLWTAGQDRPCPQPPRVERPFETADTPDAFIIEQVEP